jgi:hypothetical protein
LFGRGGWREVVRFWGKIFFVQGASPWRLTKNFLGYFRDENNEVIWSHHGLIENVIILEYCLKNAKKMKN